MAAALNQTRMRETRTLAVFCLLIMLFTRPWIAVDGAIHHFLEWTGYALLILAAFGRLWCTVYIGGWKNSRVVEDGPYSIVRNPLYIFTMIAAVGIGFATTQFLLLSAVIIILPLIYLPLARREANHMLKNFGDDYIQYRNRVPGWIPNFAIYQSSSIIEVRPRYLFYCLRDVVWLFVVFPALQMLEYLREIDFLPTFIVMP